MARDDFTLAENLEDLERHQREHNERIAYTYTVMDLTATETLGCIYIFPRTMRWLTNVKSTPIGAKDWPDYEAVILFWIRQSRLAEEMDHRLLNVLRSWMAEAWTFDGLLFMTTEPFEQQVALFEEAGLQKQVELEHPKIAGKFLGYT